MMWKAVILSIILGILSAILGFLVVGPVTAQVTKIMVDPHEIPKRQSWGFRRVGAVGGGVSALSYPAGNDPGVRTGSPTMGGQLSGLSSDEVNFANAGVNLFAGAWSVTGTVLGEPFPGLGPYYDTLACGSCHDYPSLGGSGPIPNNEVGAATLDGATNDLALAPFITSGAPTVLAYQKSTGATMRLFSIAGRSDAGGCTAPQIDFRPLIAANDLSFHIPVPLFGIGLVESTNTDEFVSRQVALPGGVPWTMAGLGITTGRFNHGNLGQVSTIGWKGGASSVRSFAALALAVELGVSSEIYPRKIDPIAGCLFNGLPEDGPRLTRRVPNTASVSADYAAVGEGAAAFARSLAPPTPQTSYTSSIVGSVTSGMIANGQAKFIEVGCVACHTQSHTTGNSILTGQTGVTYSSWSDYALHNMGVTLRDGLSFGSAGPQDFRTPALWGSGQRHFFMHDGRDTDLNGAIQDHKSTGSEANAVVDLFNALSTADQQGVLNFLRSL